MIKKALQYFHRMRREGFSLDASRNSTLIVSTDPADFERRMRRYPLESTMEQGVTCGSQAEAVRALDRRHKQIKKGVVNNDQERKQSNNTDG